MAAVSSAPRPQQFPSMSSRRLPLANNPNAANSPFRNVPVLKRPRTTTDRDHESLQSPPKKRQIIEANNGSRRVQHIPVDEKEGKVFLGQSENVAPNAFQKRLAAVREGKQGPQKSVQRTEKPSQADAETVKQWKRHYRRVFPTYVFYFENLPQDVCLKASRQISNLGAREEKFFSKSVTHIVTSRPIPSSPSDVETAGRNTSSSKLASAQVLSGQRTINPSLLDRSADLQSITQRIGRHGTEFSSLQRKSQLAYQENEVRRTQAGNTDVLHKGLEMNMKIWALEKFERMMDTLFDLSPSHEVAEIQPSRKIAAPLHTVKQEPKLSQLLREEKNMPAERTPWSEIIPFRGVYVYVHDVTEKTRPVMVREYPRVAQKEDGEWPQFRSVPLPRCPFVEDVSCSKSDAEAQKAKENDKKRIEEEARKAEQQQPRTRAASAAIEAAKHKTNTERTEKPVLHDAENATNRMPKPALLPPMSKTYVDAPPARAMVNGIDSMPPQLGSARFHFPGLARPGKEPMASGVQQSHVTSAIRSQMISSTAAGPAGKAGTSKEMHQLQRRAVERRSGLSAANVPSSYHNDVKATTTGEEASTQRRITRRTNTAPMTRIHEDRTMSEEEDEDHAAVTVPAAAAPKKKKPVKVDLKPGYCENCRDKYEDFNEHIESRKHKKFAITQENWSELDSLLKKLNRR